FVANFVGSPGMNFIEGLVERSGAGAVFVPSGTGPKVAMPVPETNVDGAATLGVRPEYVRTDEAGFVEGEIVLDEYLGSHHYAHVKTPYGRVVMRAHASHPVGSTVKLSFAPGSLHLFDRGTGQNSRSPVHA